MINLPADDGIYIRDYINKYRRKHNILEPEETKKQGFEVPNLDDILGQQEIIEQQRMDTERLENTGRRMM